MKHGEKKQTTLQYSNVAIETHLFIVEFPIQSSIYNQSIRGFPVAMFDDRRVTIKPVFRAGMQPGSGATWRHRSLKSGHPEWTGLPTMTLG